MASENVDDRIAARLELVEEHIRLENQHDLEGIMGTFGATARYDDEPLAAQYTGRDEVRTYYESLLQALPGLHLDVRRTHASASAVVVEVIIRGRHLGPWRGLPATGREIEIPLCGIFTFDDEDRLAGEKIYYDRATLLRQLGLFHEPDSAVGHWHHAHAPPHDGTRRRAEALEARLSTSEVPAGASGDGSPNLKSAGRRPCTPEFRIPGITVAGITVTVHLFSIFGNYGDSALIFNIRAG
jgi:steroid delta-isomerase-like uncharacterized protein